MRNLLFFDIDGTLAIGKEVPESAARALKEVRSQGDKVFICTGRPLGYVSRYFSEYADGFVCSNGRFAILDGEVIFDEPITHEAVLEIAQGIADLDGEVVFFDQQHGYYYGKKENMLKAEKAWGEGFLIHGLPDETIAIYNFDIFFHDVDHLERIREAFKGRYIFNSHLPHPSADTTIVGVDKATTIKAIEKALNYPHDHIFAFGDGENDITMIKEAGVGIAMGNAIDEVKAVADYITKPILEDGVYHALKAYHLIES